MKKIILIFLLLIVKVHSQSLSGSGTLADPYQIYNADDMSDVRNYLPATGEYFKMMNDIDLDAYSDWE